MTTLELRARPRTVVGKRVKNLRRKGIIPANVYGHNVSSQPLELNAHDFALLQRHLSPSSLIDLVVEGSAPHQVMIHRTQRNVRTGLPIHVELFQVNPHERLSASVPLVLVGESEVVRRGEGVVLLQEQDSIEVHIANRRLFDLTAGTLRLGAWEHEHLHDCVVCQSMVHIFRNQQFTPEIGSPAILTDAAAAINTSACC